MTPVVACSTSGFKTSLDAALARIAALGFGHVDLIAISGWDHVDLDRLTDDFDAEANRIAGALAAHRLTPVALNCAPAPQSHQRGDAAANARRRATFAAVARLARRLGVPRASYYPGYWRADLRPWEDAFADALETYREIARIGADAGIEFLLEPHAMTLAERPEQLRPLLAALPELRVAYDPSHFAHAGLAPADTEFLLDRTAHVHLRDAMPGKLHAPCGSGHVDFAALGHALHARGYCGHLSLEPLPGFAGDLEAEIKALAAVAQQILAPA
jgi:sugar phosphate isomerase/epimerase